MTANQLWQYCMYRNDVDTYSDFIGCLEETEEDTESFTPELWSKLQKLDIKTIIVAFEMDKHNLNRDSVLEYISKTAATVEDGYKVFNWNKYVYKTLSIGYRANQLQIIDDNNITIIDN